ncbi:LPXTG cell wall anchor domain-containing protein [Micromonospora sp. SL4-19]|uniref:LPXTG cell wall anchor domain-containing protein n=1 Tax=Micromonospora sp. SL4-19 TaxID=3399129 RepID=UPI003A4E2446
MDPTSSSGTCRAPPSSTSTGTHGSTTLALIGIPRLVAGAWLLISLQRRRSCAGMWRKGRSSSASTTR